jgi:thiosulfate reductase / polysulfide reductase chain A
MKRRKFIKISSLSASAAIFANSIFDSQSRDEKKRLQNSRYLRYPNYCEICFWNCAGWVYSREDSGIWKIAGNKKDPNSNGRFCPRGTGGVGMYMDSDRLKKPMLRVSENGKETFKPVSWDKALSVIAEKFTEIKAEHGAESIALFKHGSSGKHFNRLMKAFGTVNIAGPAYAQCKGPREEAFDITFGKPLKSPEPLDIDNTKCLVLIGSHLGENMHNGQVQEMSNAIDKKATIITVDPRFSTAASKSDFWLPVQPATDLALLLAWMNVIIEEDLYDKEYLEKYAIGFDELKAHVAEFTPEWAEDKCKIEASLIRETARRMAYAAPSVIINPGRHVTWYGDDTQRLRAVAILNAILGAYGRKGGIYFPQKTGLPGFPAPAYPKANWGWKDIADGKYEFAKSSVTNVLIDASLPESPSDKKIKAWIVVGSNLPLTMPDTKRTISAIENLDFLVAVDTMPMEITGYADVVLPECTYLERHDDIRVAQNRIPTLAIRVPAARPKYHSKPGWWIAQQLGIKLGLDDFFNYTDYKDVLEWQLEQIGMTYDDVMKQGVVQFGVDEKKLYIEGYEDYHFKTPSGKIELYSTRLKEAGFDPLPVYTEHPEPPENFYRLNYGRAPMHTFSRTSNNPNLTDMMDENKVWVNPKVADQWNLSNGEEVYLENQDGVVTSFPIKVRVTERIRPDSIYMIHGFGHSNKNLTRAHGKGASDSELITNVLIDPLMGGTGLRGNFVTFKKNMQTKEELES